MNDEDISWKQRFSNFKKAYHLLEKFILKGNLTEFEKQGLIQAFEYTYELSWNTIKDYYEYQGETGIQGSRDAFRMAIRRELIDKGELWMDMIQSRQKSSHTYDEKIADEIVDKILKNYFNLFKKLLNTFNTIEKNSY